MSPGDQNSLIGRKVATVTFGLFASKDYIERSGPLNSPEDLANHDGVMATIMDDKVLWVLDSRGEPIHLPKRITFRSNSIWAFDEAIRSGFGIGALPLFGANRAEEMSSASYPVFLVKKTSTLSRMKT